MRFISHIEPLHRATPDADCRDRDLLEVIAAALEERELVKAAAAAANRLATQLGCQRVTVGLWCERRVRIVAMSRDSAADSGTAAANGIAAAMEEAIDQDAAVLHPRQAGAAPRIDRAHRELAVRMSAGAVCTFPFADAGRIAGAITLEHANVRAFDERTLRHGQAVAALLGPLLEGRRREQSGIGERALDSLRQLGATLSGPTHMLPKFLLAATLIALAVGSFATATYRVTANAVLRGTVQRVVVAPVDGYLASATARAGDHVRKGQVIAALDDRALRLEEMKSASEYDRALKEYREAMAELDSVKVGVRRAQLDRIAAELQLARDNLDRASIVAPIDGVIVSGDLSQTLGAPIRRGETLFEVAPLNEYRVSLQVDERDVGYVRAAQQGRVALGGFPAAPLPFTIERITPVSIARDGHNFFEVEARLARTPDVLRPGMQGVGKIEAGPRRLLWIWTHRPRDWLAQHLWALVGWSAAA